MVLGTFRSALHALALTLVLAHPGRARADRGAFTLEGGGALRLGAMRPSIGTGDQVVGTLGGAWLGVRYGFTNRIDVQLRGFWDAPATFVQRPVTVNGTSGALTQEVSRWGAAAGVRYVVAGIVWRMPVGFEVGWAHTSVSSRDLVDPATGASLGLVSSEGGRDQLLLAPFAGLEWAATDHLTFSIIPRLELLVGSQSTVGVVVPLAVGWSWFWPL